MKANPGGELLPSHVFGRDKLIQQLWRILDRQSVVLTAERRMGKTSTLKKMRAEVVADWLPLYQDLEGVRTRLEFVEKLYQELKPHLGKQQRAYKSFASLMEKCGGIEISGILKLPAQAGNHWKTLLDDMFADVAANTQQRFLFLWDELPLMVQNIKSDEGEPAAMELLDTLRGLRQTYNRIRMLYTGSIGLHHVVADLKRSGYANAPINDMHSYDMPPLTPNDSQALAAALLQGEGIDHDAGVARGVAESVGHIPYYIHHVIDQLAFSGERVALASIANTVETKLLDAQDAWDMGHYRQRIDTYYPTEQGVHALALALLDALALEAEPCSIDAIKGHVKVSPLNVDHEQLLNLLNLLTFDNYLVRTKVGYQFRHKLVKQWWLLQRGL